MWFQTENKAAEVGQIQEEAVNKRRKINEWMREWGEKQVTLYI